RRGPGRAQVAGARQPALGAAGHPAPVPPHPRAVALSTGSPAMSADAQKRLAAETAIRYVEDGTVVGVGTGSTVAFFIEALGGIRDRIRGAVSSSERSTALLRRHGIEVLDLNAEGPLPPAVDRALTREKIIAAASQRFVCVIDPAKQVDVLGRFPLPVEVIPMARSHVARELAARGGNPVWRDGTVTDNGNWILDVHNLRITDPVATERDFNQIAGVVTVGLFAARPADVVIVGDRVL